MARTAYQEALDAARSSESEAASAIDSNIPSYMVASDTLNVANQNRTFAEATLDAVESVPKFISVSLLSGANQLYNIPADIGNLFGGDFERSDTTEVISTLDSNLGEFYKEHQEGADLVGFVISSAVPGLGGIKILNAGQKSLRTAVSTGRFGENTGTALGLLSNSIRKPALDRALREATTNASAASITNANALKALGAGFGQNALEALAFETAVAATLFNSPILENQDFGDFVFNVAVGAGVFGIVGSAVDAAKISFSIKNVADKAAIEARPWTFIAEPAAASRSYERVVLDFEQLNTMPAVPKGFEQSRQTFLNNAAVTKTTKLEQRIRKEIGIMSGGDENVAETMFQSFKTSSLASKSTAFSGLEEITMFNATSKLASKAEKLSVKVASGKATLKEAEELAASNIKVTYAKAWGEDIGRVTTDTPVITSLVDTLKKGEVITVSATGVKAGKKKFAFNTRFNKGKDAGKGAAAWNILKANTFEAQARYIWAGKLPRFEPTLKQPLSVHVDDIPLMEKVMADVVPEDLVHVRFMGLKEDEFMGSSLRDFIGKRKVTIANRLLNVRGEKATLLTSAKAPPVQDEIASIVNVKSSFLNGELLRDTTGEFNLRDILALQDHAETYTAKLVAQGSRKQTDGIVDIWQVPQHVKLTYDTTAFKGIDNHLVENMTIIKEQQKLYQAGTSRASANVLGEDYFKLEDINSGKVFSGAVPSGAGAGFVSAASANYGTLAASVENIGSVTSRMIEKGKTRSREVFEPLLYKLGNNQEAAIEWSSLNQRVRSIEGEYAMNSAGDALEPAILVRWKRMVAEAQEAGTTPPKQPVLTNPAMEERIELLTDEVRQLAKAHIEVNGDRTAGLAGIRTAQGVEFNRAPDVFYPIPIEPKDFPHFALVIDESITSGNHTKTLFATSEQDLAQQAAKLKENPHLRVLFKKEAEDYYKSVGQFDYEKTINNNYLDVEAHRKGVSAPFIVATDPRKITDDMLNWHLQRESGLVREAVASKYEVQFAELERLGDEFTAIGSSKFSDLSLANRVSEVVKNPFADYVKTALAIKKTSDYPWWVNVNRMADEAASSLLKRATAVMERAKTPAELAEVNRMLLKGGYKGAAYDESMEIFANTGAQRGALSTVVQKANSIIATVVLRLDTLNAVNNAVSANVLLGAETKAITRAIGRGDAEAVGALAKLMGVRVPGTGEVIKSPKKLIANAVMKFNRSSDEMKFYEDNGFITSISAQYRGTLDNLAYNGRESVRSWDSRVTAVHDNLRDLATTGEKWTGNKLAEEFNRFVAADVMKQMTDVAVARNLMTGKEQLAYINTFVNRTQGNYLASQRPMMFSGPIGQAIGLFQTYQFNLLQQMLRHVGEGHGKDSMVLLGLQGTIHGMNGLPAFNALNTHLVGNASGNKEHKDAYDALYGIAGKEAGDWLMYGMASNLPGLIDPDLKVNLYTRGDINPRHVTIVPTDPSQVAAFQASSKVFANLFNTAKELAAGGDITTTLLKGLEHNGLSRPLAGLAQTLKGLDNPEQASYSTSKRGNVIASNDFFSLVNLGRVVGGKPLDEAIALDATYRYKAYGLEDAHKRQVLGRAIKSTMIAGQNPTQDQVEDFALRYAEVGGRQEEFSKWFTQLYKTANISQANSIQNSLRSPFTQSMQSLMGGRLLRDFSEK